MAANDADVGELRHVVDSECEEAEPAFLAMTAVMTALSTLNPEMGDAFIGIANVLGDIISTGVSDGIPLEKLKAQALAIVDARVQLRMFESTVGNA